MTVLPGYEFASWEQGYGDIALQPDLTTIRRIPWLEATALVMCDARSEEDASTGRGVAAPDPATAGRARGRARLHVHVRVRARVLLVPRVARRSRGQGLHEPHAALARDRGLPRPADDTRRVPDPRDPQRRRRRRHPGRVLEGRSRVAGSTRSTSSTATPVEMADRHVIYKNAAKEIASQFGRAITFMAKYSEDEVGSSCHVHSSVWNADASESLMWDARRAGPPLAGVPGLARRPDRVRARARVDVRADRQLVQALPARVVGADRARVERRQPHVRLPARRPRSRRSGSSPASPAPT